VKGLLIGIPVGIICLVGGVYLFLRIGLLDPSAAQPPSKFESTQAMKFLDAAVERHATGRENPIPPTDENLQVGLQIYEAHCASCHGDRMNPRSSVGLALYPRAPQFLDGAPDMPDSQNFYIIRNGIRWTGMPGWKNVLDENDIWKLTTFLAHIDHLPSAVSQKWNASQPASPVTPSIRPKGANRHE
jgi:mono/diheme cytochrome c family protein